MAIMIPEKPHEFEPASQEGLMFDALSKLPDDYFVFHSFRITSVENNTLYESETDFIIFNRKYGVICLEAKAGQVKYDDGYWYYGNGEKMHNGGPFNQASRNKYNLIKEIEKTVLDKLVPRCKMLHAVWFPSISEDILRKMTLPSEADRKLILTKEALENPEPYLERIFSIELPARISTNLSEYEAKRLIREVFCPKLNIFPASSFDNDLKKIVFHKLLKEQSAILNYLTEQKTAVINGAAGTGKTMIAVEKAQRHARYGEKVLFLCYNAELKKFLEENFHHDNISYYTIPGLACKMCSTDNPDYVKFSQVLDDYYLSVNPFPYQHVIIDEGQDFGMDAIEETNLLQQIEDIIVDNNAINGSFYVFYDKLQLVQAKRVPRFIEDADCKLTLYRNCRNTENIAKTSLRPISERKPFLLEGCVKGAPAKIHFCSSDKAAICQIDETINVLKEKGYNDIVILTSKTESTSILKSRVKDNKYRNEYKFTTCRKFKGLEADAIILVDVDGDTFNSKNVLIFYVGASRARLSLDIITELTDENCEEILKNALNYTSRIRNPKRELAGALNAIGRIVKDPTILPVLTDDDMKLKVGQLVRKVMEQISAAGYNLPELDKMQTVEWGHRVLKLGLKYPFLKKYDTGDPDGYKVDGYIRYYCEPLKFTGELYYVTKELYENNKEPFIEWYKSLK